jgi:hypothetical protein
VIDDITCLIVNLQMKGKNEEGRDRGHRGGGVFFISPAPAADGIGG